METIKFGYNEDEIGGDLFVELYSNELSVAHPHVSYVGNSVIEGVQRLGVKIPDNYFDFLTIALAVTAADTFINRENAPDSWTRIMTLQIPVCLPELWEANRSHLERTLKFLTGDMWTFEFRDGGKSCPEFERNGNFKTIDISELDCVSLFSGGLDSAIGAIDFLAEGMKPLFVSHGYKGDATKQKDIGKAILNDYHIFRRFNLNADPKNKVNPQNNDITMRGRSFNFMAFAVVGAAGLIETNELSNVDLYIPENGVISLNAPLTKRRIGSLSTRTTHPFFLSQMQILFNNIGIDVTINNPYQFKTKGEMVSECRDRGLLQQIIDETVSCSHWKRTNEQCGVCVPCLIRRAACYKGGINTLSGGYTNTNLPFIKTIPKKRDDLFAVIEACLIIHDCDIPKWIRNSGPLPIDNETRELFVDLFERGIWELSDFLRNEGVIN